MSRSAIVMFVEELVAQGVASEAQCADAIEAHRAAGGSFIEHLVLAGVNERALLLPLCTALELVPAAASAVRQPEPRLANIFEYRLANRLLVVPYQLGDDRTLHLACADPFIIRALPDDLPPFILRAATLTDVRAGLDAHLNLDPKSETAPDSITVATGERPHRNLLVSQVTESPPLEPSSSAVPDALFYGELDDEPDGSEATTLKGNRRRQAQTQTQLDNPLEVSETMGDEDSLSDEPA